MYLGIHQRSENDILWENVYNGLIIYRKITGDISIESVISEQDDIINLL